MNNFAINRIVERHAKEYNIKLDVSKKQFKALEDFLELANNSKLSCFPDKTIDSFWHTFIIHTKTYENYCKTKFGKFVHHNPIDRLEKPIEGFYCFYNGAKHKFEYKRMFIDQAVCDGGGGSCSSCNNDG